MEEKRKLTRFIFEVPAKVKVLTSGGRRQIFDLLTSNICAGGAFFPTQRALPEGADVEIDLTLPLHRLKGLVDCQRVSVKVNGTVVRSESTGMAVRFNQKYRIEPFYEAVA
jgi:hypothetical protein